MRSLYKSIRVDQLLFALTGALDMVDVRFRLHAYKVAYVSIRLGIELNLGDEELRQLFSAALLHDIGLLSDKEKGELVNWDIEKEGFLAHSETGYKLLCDTSDFSSIADTVRYHHVPYNKLQSDQLFASIIHLADRVSVAAGKNIPDNQHINTVLKWVQSKEGKLFHPKIVKVLVRLSKKKAFWLDLTTDYVYDRCIELSEIIVSERLSNIMDIGRLFANVIDMRSPFTKNHSVLVAEIARTIGAKVGFSHEECDMLELAGLLHDLGKLAIPNTILEKKGDLTMEERNIIKSHTYFTYNVLNHIDGADTIKEWAAYHHERIDGKGYPFRIEGENLSLGSRIMAVADVYAALSEKRPYKDSMEKEKVTSILRKNAKGGGLDSFIVEVAEEI